MNFVNRLLPIFALILAFTAAGTSQVATGIPAFNDVTAGQPDLINIGNLNIHLTIPIVHRPGRGLSFNYDLTYDSSVWYPVGSSGSESWQPASSNWGWSNSAGTGHYTYQTTTTPCYSNGHQIGAVAYIGPWTYYDAGNTPHPFSGGLVNVGACPGTNVYSFTSVATDSSGFTLQVTNNGGNVVVSRPDGVQIALAGTPSITDTNGNQITGYTDTLNVTALTVSGDGHGNTLLTYPGPSGNASITESFTSYTIKTNFGCLDSQGHQIAEFTSSGAVSLPTAIILPDDTTQTLHRYTITYEQTPGYSSAYSTGRIASITLPTGGTISYTYTGGNNGINCTDGSTAGLYRYTPDTGANYWNYARQQTSQAPNPVRWQTTVTDPQSNQSLYTFEVVSSSFQEEQRKVQTYNGSSQVLNKTVDTCYNGHTPDANGTCITNSTALTQPITQIDVYTRLPGPTGVSSQATNKYDSTGSLLLETDAYDFGAKNSINAGSKLRQTTTSYASLGNNITTRPYQVSVYDGASNLKSQATYSYDGGSLTSTVGTAQHIAISGSRGNVTGLTRLVQGSTVLSQSYSYFDTGVVNTSNDVNGAITTNVLGTDTGKNCYNAFPVEVDLPPVSAGTLKTYATWNCTGGVRTGTTDANGNTTSTTYSDPYYWRPISATDQASFVTNISYTPTTVESVLSFNSGSSAVDELKTIDPLGRTSVVQQRRAPGSTYFDTTAAQYDSTGRAAKQLLPYEGTAGQMNANPITVNTTYDGAGRPVKTIDANGGYTQQTYNYNDVLMTAGPPPVGENTKQRQFEYDGLGRFASVCEVTSSSGSGNCGQSNSLTGYWTKYTYDALGHLLTVSQNAQGTAQNRTYTYDGLGRMLMEANPENGTTTYVYDTDTTCGTYTGDLVKKIDAVGNVTCYAYDALHRVTSTRYSAGSYAANTPDRCLVYDSASVNSQPMQNASGRLAEAFTVSHGAGCTASKLTDEGFSYSVRGETATIYQKTPNSGGYYTVQAGYYANGVLSTLSASMNGMPNMSYGLDAEGRLKSATDLGHTLNLVTTTTYSESGSPVAIEYGNGDRDSFYHDANTNRVTGYVFSLRGSCPAAVAGALNWNPLGSLEQLIITDSSDSSKNHSCQYSSDDLGRIASVNCGATWAQTFSYDAFGNIKKNASVGISYLAGYDPSTNRVNSGVPYSYDANGNMLNDNGNTFSWTAANQPLVLNATTTLTYDALGRTVELQAGSTFTQIVYAPSGAKLAVMQNGTTLVKATIPLPGGGKAVYNASGFAYFRHVDWLGNSRLATKWDHSVYSKEAYAPFGEPYNEAGTQDRSFTGEDQDSSNGLYDFLYRRYNSTSGRWFSPDPAGMAAVDSSNPQTWNRYAYVRNSPLTYVDPDGTSDDFSNPWDGAFRWGPGPLSDHMASSIMAIHSGDTGMTGPYQSELVAVSIIPGMDIPVDTGSQEQSQSKSNSSTQTLSWRTVEGGPGSGKNYWAIFWQLFFPSQDGGYIVQEVDLSTTTMAGPFPVTVGFVYWEAWEVASGDPITLNQSKAAPWDDKFNIPGATTYGTARFYEGLQTLPDSFKVGNVGWAGILPSTTVNPNLSTDNATSPVTRGPWTIP